MINISTMNQRKDSGFTITELLVATAVFAGVLLLAIVGFIQIGRLFYKGVTVSQTRQAASQAMDAVTSDIRLSSGVIPTSYTCNTQCGGGANSLSAYCIGNHLYIYNRNYLVNLSSHDFVNNFGLVQSQLPGGGCKGGMGSYTSAELATAKPVEMLGDDMRVISFKVDQNQLPASSFRASVVLSYGEDSVFNNLGSVSPLPTCKGIATGSQFCAVISLGETAANRPSLGP